MPGRVAAARAARDLRDELERLLGGAEVREVQERVGRQHADGRHAREVVPLGDHLRSDQARDAAATSTSSTTAAALRGGAPCRGRARRRGLPGRAPRSARRRARCRRRSPRGRRPPHSGQRSRTRHPLAAVVADERAPALVDGARDAALRAAEVVAAVAAEQKRRVARGAAGAGSPALRAAKTSRSRSTSGAREERDALLVRTRRSRACRSTIVDLRQRARRRRARQREGCVSRPSRAACVRLDARASPTRRRAPRSRRSRADRHDLAGVVARRLALLVGGVVLFVHDEEAGIDDGREDAPSAARSRPAPRRAATRSQASAALALGERGVEERPRGRRTARWSSPGEDGRQRDLRHEPDRAAARFERRGDRPQVDLGLAAARDALEERREGSGAPGSRAAIGLDGAVLLLGRQSKRAAGPASAGATPRLPRAAPARTSARRPSPRERLAGRPSRRPVSRADLRARSRAGRAPRDRRATSALRRLRPSSPPRSSASRGTRQRRPVRPGAAALAPRETGRIQPRSSRARSASAPARRPGRSVDADGIAARERAPGCAASAPVGPGERPALGDPVPDGAGRGQPRRQRALQDLARRREESLGDARGGRRSSGGHTGSTSSTSTISRSRRPGRGSAARRGHDAGQRTLAERDADARPGRGRLERPPERGRRTRGGSAAAARRRRTGSRSRWRRPVSAIASATPARDVRNASRIAPSGRRRASRVGLVVPHEDERACAPASQR